MTADQLCKKYPRLYHMATADALPQIERYGLLSTQAVLELLEIDGEEREKLSATRRPKNVALNHPQHGRFVLRDQKPMRDIPLARCLVGMSIPEWYRMLNERVFLWATRQRVETLLSARAYRSESHLVLTIDTQRLVRDHESDLRLSSINSGATLYTPPLRGVDTFSPLINFEALNARRPVVEVTIAGSIPRIKDYLIDAVVRKAS